MLGEVDMVAVIIITIVSIITFHIASISDM